MTPLPPARRPASPLRRISGRGLSGLLVGAALLWLAWPWLRPRLWPARGPAWLVVLDGYHRLDRALAVQRRQPLPILLISCPATGQPTPQQWRQARAPLLLLRQGVDTAGQMAALGRWRPQLPIHGGAIRRPLAAPAVVWLVSDPAHLPRATLAAQIALGPAGTRVLPLPAPLPGAPPPQAAAAAPSALSTALSTQWPLWRDALRLQLWRLSGSTGAGLRPDLLARKRLLCFGTRPASPLPGGLRPSGQRPPPAMPVPTWP